MYYYVTYAFESESIIYNFLNDKEITETSDIAPVSSKEFLDIQASIECGLTLKLVRDMIITYSQMHRTEKYSQHSSVIWPVWLNG